MTAYEFVTDILLGMMDPEELEQIVQEMIEKNGYDDDKDLIEIHDLLVFQNSAMKEFKQKYKEIETKYNAPVA
jgi:NADH:ubiquinone oxidoreductase subunit E